MKQDPVKKYLEKAMAEKNNAFNEQEGIKDWKDLKIKINNLLENPELSSVSSLIRKHCRVSKGSTIWGTWMLDTLSLSDRYAVIQGNPDEVFEGLKKMETRGVLLIYEGNIPYKTMEKHLKSIISLVLDRNGKVAQSTGKASKTVLTAVVAY